MVSVSGGAGCIRRLCQ